MPKMTNLRVKIVSTGMYLPDNVYTNDKIIARIKKTINDPNDPRLLQLSAEKIEANTGIRQRYYADLTRETNPETALFMGKIALERALLEAGWNALDLDFIIFSTVSVGNNPGDFLIPSVACHLQQDIGAFNAMAYDLKAACSGWVYGMSQAIVNIEAGFAGKGAIICSETQERGLDFSDPATCVLIGDLAVATLVEKSDKINVEFLRTEANNERQLKNIIQLNDANVYGDKNALTRPFFRLNGSRVYKEGIRHMSALVKETLSETNNSIEDIDHFIFHQANGSMLKRVAKMTGIPPEKNLMNIAEVGNTTSATIPSVLHMYIENGTIKKGDKVLFTAFGGGVTSGTILMEI
jgi:3-oxoacyl-[acyl-carrier-protein] synthase III